MKRFKSQPSIFWSVTLFAVLSFCTTSTEKCYAENVITYALKGSPHSLDPMTTYDVPTHSFNANHIEALVDRDRNLNLIPCLATEWQNTNPTTWRFKLRQGVKFHEGEDFTADDVIFSLARAKGKGSDVAGALASIKEIKKVDSHTIDIITHDQNPILPAELYSLAIFSKSWCEKNNAVNVADVTKKEESYADKHSNGTGPYKVTSYQPEVSITLEKNSNWWGGTNRGNVDKAIFKPIPSDATRVAGLLSGELDLIAPVPIQDIERIKSNPKLKIIESPALLTLYVGMNQFDEKLKTTGLDKNPFKDIRVREAFYRAIDVNAIRSKIMRGYSEPTGLMIGQGTNGFNKDLNTRVPYDIEKSKQLLTEAGYPNGFSLGMDCPNDRYIKDEMICQSIAQMLAKIGIKVNLTTATKSKFFQKVLGYDTDFYLLGWMPSTYDAHDAYYNLIATRKGSDQGKFNIGNFSNAKVDELVAKIHKEMDQTKRNELIAEVMKITQDNFATIPLHQEKLIYGTSKKITDLPIRADDMIFIKDFNIE